MDAATKHVQKLHQKQRSKQENQEKWAKRIAAKVTKTTNDLLGSKWLTDVFNLKHKNFFHYNSKCYVKPLLHRTWYIKKFQFFWKKLVNSILYLQQETRWK